MRKNVSMEENSVCIVGAGNAAHALAPWLVSRGYEVRWYAPFDNEAEKLNDSYKSGDGVQVEFNTVGQHYEEPLEWEASTPRASVSSRSHEPPHGIFYGRPHIISPKAEDTVKGCKIIIILTPSFAYETTFREIKDYLSEDQLLLITPGQGGVDWICNDAVGKEIYNKLNICTILPMPVNCRVNEFGKKVTVTGFKQNYKLSCKLNKNIIKENRSLIIKKYLTTVLNIFDASHVEHVGPILYNTLYPANGVMHPSRNYCMVGENYKTDDILLTCPYFYEDMDELSLSLITSVSCECSAIGQILQQKLSSLSKDVIEIYGSCKIPSILHFLQYVYGAKKYQNLHEMFAKNPAYAGYRGCLTKISKSDNGKDQWLPDFTHRYYTEDIPHGLCVVRGLADILNVNTPNIDKVIIWAQKHMKKEYLVNGKMNGKDVKETSAPQRFNIKSVDELVSYF